MSAVSTSSRFRRFWHMTPWTARTAGGWEDSPTQTGSGAMAAGRGESPEPDVLALILSPSSSDEEPD